MRHLIGLGLAVILSLTIFFAGAWGYLRLLRLPASTGTLSVLPAGGGSLLSYNDVLTALAAVGASGVLAGVLAIAPRISPLATGLPGVLLTGWTALYLVSVRRAVTLIPLRSHSFGAGLEAMLFNGLLGAAGLAMIIPLFVPSRWRSRATEPDESEVTEARRFVASLYDAADVPTAAGAAPVTSAPGTTSPRGPRVPRTWPDGPGAPRSARPGTRPAIPVSDR
jgi:hypothetical protein